MVNAEPELRLQNALANNSSPYVSLNQCVVDLDSNPRKLRAHKDNPVAWQEWSEETLALAKRCQRLIFLSIGYHACHCKKHGLISLLLGLT